MFVVGAIVAAAMSMPDAAAAAPHRFLRFHATSAATRSLRQTRVLRHASVHLRPVRGRLRVARRETFVAPTAPVGRRQAAQLRRIARRGRFASLYRPVMAYGSSGRASARHRLATRSRLAAAFRPVLPTRVGPSIVASAAGAGLQTGRASFYHGGGRTAAGGRVGAATCAHRWLPFGTRVLVTNLANARRAVLTVNDRGPFVGGRIVDVSPGAAGILGMLHSGTAPVSVQVVGGRG